MANPEADSDVTCPVVLGIWLFRQASLFPVVSTLVYFFGVCAVGVYLWRLWPEEWQAGLVFVLFGLLVLAPVTIKEISQEGTGAHPIPGNKIDLRFVHSNPSITSR